MAIVIATKADPFQEKFNQRATRAQSLSQFGLPRDYSHVRRPFRGIVLKEDTYATLEVFEADGTPVPLINAGSRTAQDQIEAIVREKIFASELGDSLIRNKADQERVAAEVASSFTDAAASQSTVLGSDRLKKNAVQYKEALQDKVNAQKTLGGRLERFLSDQAYSLRYSNFLMTGAQEARAEKYQIMETFGIPFIFFYGERPRIYQFNGVLLNSLDFQWRAEFWANYDDVLRGTRLVERNARVVLSWDDITIEGYILQAAAAEDAAQPYLVNFNFQFFVTNYMTTAVLGDPRFPTPAAVSIDTSLWRQSDIATKGLREPSTTNVDKMRRLNLQTAAQEQSTGLLGALAQGLAVASTFATLATDGLENFVKNFETLAAGRDLRYPVGAFPVLSEIQQSSALSSLLEDQSITGTPTDVTNEIVANQLSEQTRNLVRGFATDAAGRPEIFVQDKDLIVSLTKKYNSFAFRRIKILPPGGVFAPITNQKYFSGYIRDNADEYVQHTTTGTQPYEPPDQDIAAKGLSSLELDQIIGQMIKKFRAAGVPTTKKDIEDLQMERYFSQAGALRVGVAGGSFATAQNDRLPEPDSTFATDEEVAAAQAGQIARVQQTEIRSSPKANLAGMPAGTVMDTKVIASSSIEPKPRNPTKPVITPSQGTAPVLSRSEIDSLLKQARMQNARSS
ncbi:MAG: hypothetical protein KDB07_11440 [Planctomycetes bacterium]|nr:hypothetical protein [Planctomycetota bacterium]